MIFPSPFFIGCTLLWSGFEENMDITRRSLQKYQ
jgi:hypothetical protein